MAEVGRDAFRLHFLCQRMPLTVILNPDGFALSIPTFTNWQENAV